MPLPDSPIDHSMTDSRQTDGQKW